MTTKQEIISALKVEYPEIRIGGGDLYETLSAEDYEKAIGQWADAQLDKEAEAEKVKQSQADKVTATAKLEALGLTTDDLKALGLGSN